MPIIGALPAPPGNLFYLTQREEIIPDGHRRLLYQRNASLVYVVIGACAIIDLQPCEMLSFPFSLSTLDSFGGTLHS